MLPDVLSVILRALGWLAIVQAGGAAMFLALFGDGIDAARRPILRLTRIAALAAIVLLVAQYLLEPARMTASLTGVFDSELQRFLLHTRAAKVLALRLAGVALLLWALRRDGAGLRRYGLAGAILIAASFPLTGHSAESPERWLLMPLLGLHLLVVEFWFGALLPLIWVSERDAASRAASTVESFSRLAGWVVPLIFLAGLVIALRLLPDFGAVRTPYGAGLLLKALAFSVLLGLAAMNKWRFGPALAGGSRQAALRLRQSIYIEFVLIGLVVMGTATLTTFWSPLG